MTDKFKTSMDRIVESLEGDTPSTDIYADSIQRIADALENGSGGGGVGVLCVRPTYENRTLTLDKTYKEIFDAVSGGTFVFILTPSIDDNYEIIEGICETRYVESVGYSDDEYYVYSASFNYTAQTEDGYPSATLE